MRQNKEQDLLLLEPVLAAYAGQPGTLITILQQAQQIYGYLSTDVLYRIAEATGQTPAEVMGVATFYTQFRLQPVGKHLISLCDGTACHVNGSEQIRRAIEDELGIQAGETTEDGVFTLQTVACLGCCSLSPVMMISGETYGSLTPSAAVAILKKLRKEALPA